MTTPLPSLPNQPSNFDPVQLRNWRIRIFYTLWTMYASYYLARQNISIAIPSLEKEMGLSMMQIGWITTGLFIAYAIGQLVHGILGDKYGARKLGTIGMIGSAIANIVFGLSFSLPVFIAVWSLNGFFQATGAPLRIKVMSNWYPPRQRGKMMGLLGTDYMAGNVFCWLLSGYLIANYGWRHVFIVPGFIFLLSAIHYYFRVRNSPEEVGFPSIEAMERGETTPFQDGDQCESLSFILRQSFGNFRVWIVGFAYLGVDLVRYGFMVWAPTYMYEQGAPIDEAAYKSVMIPLVGSAGIIVSGWVTDKLGGRRAPVISVMLIVLGIAALFYRTIPQGEWLWTVILLGVIGFFLYGPHLLMGATIAMDLGCRKAAAAASGVIDAMGYVGAALAGVGTAFVKKHYGWEGAFYFWVSGAFLAALLMLLLWKYKPEKDRKYL